MLIDRLLRAPAPESPGSPQRAQPSQPQAPGMPGAPVEASEGGEDFDDDEPVEMDELDFDAHFSGAQETAEPDEAPDGVVAGVIVSLREDGAFVDIGRKSEAFLPLPVNREGKRAEEIAVGDDVNAKVTGTSRDGTVMLSLTLADRPKDWGEFQDAYQSGSPVAGRVTEAIKGGFAVDIGARAFMPMSRSGVREAEAAPQLVGQEVRCRIIQLDPDANNLVVDRRVILEEERAQRRSELLATLQPGTTVNGLVKTIREFGAFVDIGGTDALLHISDLSWGKVKDVRSVVKEGDELEVVILRVGDGGRRISVGLKQLQPDPWSAVGDKYRVGDRARGQVTKIKDFGAFVELEPGIEGLVHVSEMSWARRVRSPGDLVAVGDAVDVVVLDVQASKRRIGLGIKQALGDPWDAFAREAQVGTAVKGVVRKLEKFGAFVEVRDGVEGLLHVSDIVSDRRLNHPGDVLQVEQEVRVAVLEVDLEKRRLKLGMRQLEPDEIDRFISECSVGDVLTGRVLHVHGEQAAVELEEGVQGTCQLSASTGDAEASADTPAEGEGSADVSSLTEQLRSAWGGSAPARSESGAGAGVHAGEVHQFRVTALDAEAKQIELALA